MFGARAGGTTNFARVLAREDFAAVAIVVKARGFLVFAFVFAFVVTGVVTDRVLPLRGFRVRSIALLQI